MQELRGQLDVERRLALSRQSGDQKEYDSKINRLQVLSCTYLQGITMASDFKMSSVCTGKVPQRLQSCG